jgi:hypothetical protein
MGQLLDGYLVLLEDLRGTDWGYVILSHKKSPSREVRSHKDAIRYVRGNVRQRTN